MNSLVDALLSQHPTELIPLRCSKKMIVRLNRYFEEAVIENALSSICIQSKCPQGTVSAGLARYRQLTSVAKHLILFTCDSSCTRKHWSYPCLSNVSLFESKFHHSGGDEGFTIILDNRFSAIQTYELLEQSEQQGDATYRAVWSFEPNVIYSAIQYLMARTQALHPDRMDQFNRHVRETTPRTTSVHLTLSLMTKFAGVLQSQTEHAHAINHLSTVIRSSLGLKEVLQTAVDEIGRAVSARRCVLWLWDADTEKMESTSQYCRLEAPSIQDEELWLPVETLVSRIKETRSPAVFDVETQAERIGPSNPNMLPIMAVPVIYREQVIGMIVVEDGLKTRIWDEDEIRLIETIADQVAVAVNHARLFEKMRESSITDGLTGVYNRRHFGAQLDHEFRLCRRSQIPLSLIMIDLDFLKKINDTAGHLAGDAAIKHTADSIVASVRSTDTTARYGGEEFVVILPHTDSEAAMQVAEKIRETIASTSVPDLGHVTASLGVATFPMHAETEAELISMADQALYAAKRGGRNRVCSSDQEPIPAMFDETQPYEPASTN